MKAMLFVVGASLALLAVSIPVAYISIPPEYRQFAGPALYFLLVPVLAGVLMVGAALLAPHLFAPYRLAFPLNVTLPLVYGVFLVVSASLITHMPTALEQVPPPLEPVLGWYHPRLLLQVVAGQFALLSLLVLLSRGRARDVSR